MAKLDDDDRARMAITEVKLLGITVAKLLSIENLPPIIRSAAGRSARAFLQDMDLQLNVLGHLPDRARVQRIKALAWEFRRQMPSHLAPTLPPHDPIVQEMEARGE